MDTLWLILIVVLCFVVRLMVKFIVRDEYKLYRLIVKLCFRSGWQFFKNKVNPYHIKTRLIVWLDEPYKAIHLYDDRYMVKLWIEQKEYRMVVSKPLPSDKNKVTLMAGFENITNTHELYLNKLEELCPMDLNHQSVTVVGLKMIRTFKDTDKLKIE